MHWLARLCVRQPVLTWVMMFAIIVTGVAGYGSLGLDFFPKIDFPVVLVSTTLNGAAPEEVETGVTEKIEGAVNTISGIDELRSTSTTGVSLVIVTFALEKNADVAAQEVRDHVNSVMRELPKGIDQPIVSKLDPDAAPVVLVSLRGKGGVRDLTELADKKVRRQIEGIPGVGQVTLLGGRKRQINLWLDPVKLAASGLTAMDVQQALAQQNLTVPAGELETGPRRLSLRVEGKVPTIAAIGRIVLGTNREHPTRLEDVARVEDGSEEPSTWSSEDNQPTIVLSVRKQSGENTVGVVDALRSRIVEIQRTLPEGAELRIVRDNSAAIRTSVNAVSEHLVLGAILAALVVLLFLGDTRATLIAALAIPISIVGTFALMWVMGFTLNIITLLALALAVGIVIDDAIVVLENIVRFIQAKRQKPFVAAVLATREIGLPVLATTLSLMAVFLPLSFMRGIVGRFFMSFGITMAFAIGVSLFVSFTLTPMLSARLLRSAAPEGESRSPSGLQGFVDRFYGPVERVYLSMLRWVMARRWTVVLACGLTLGSCVPLFGVIPKGFQPENDMAEFDVNMRAPEGSSLLETRLIAERLATEIRHVPGVAHTLVTIGNSQQGTRNLAGIYVHLVDPKDRAESQTQIMERVRREVVGHQSSALRIEVSVSSQISSGQSNAGIQYTLSGPDLRRLAQYAQQAVERLKKVPGAVDVDSTLIVGNPEVRVAVDRERAANLGVQVADVASTLQLLIGGLKISTFEESGEDYDIVARAEARYRVDSSSLAAMTIRAQGGGTIPLASLTSLRDSTGPSQINRLGRQRQVTITANAAPGVGQSTVSDALKAIIADLHLAPGYSASPAGLTRETGRIVTGFLVAIGLSAVFMYLVLAAQFQSWLHPVTIMLSLPLTIPFALVSLLIFHQELSIMSALGIIVLFGVVKKNAILQVDHTNQLRARGVPRAQAIIEANRDRLRPILMTTFAFVAGMLPLIASRGIGAGMNRGIAGVVVGGQTLSLLLTLLATPVAYSLFDDVVVRWRRFRRKELVEDRGEGDLDLLDQAATEPLQPDIEPAVGGAR